MLLCVIHVLNELNITRDQHENDTKNSSDGLNGEKKLETQQNTINTNPNGPALHGTAISIIMNTTINTNLNNIIMTPGLGLCLCLGLGLNMCMGLVITE